MINYDIKSVFLFLFFLFFGKERGGEGRGGGGGRALCFVVKEKQTERLLIGCSSELLKFESSFFIVGVDRQVLRRIVKWSRGRGESRARRAPPKGKTARNLRRAVVMARVMVCVGCSELGCRRTQSLDRRREWQKVPAITQGCPPLGVGKMNKRDNKWFLKWQDRCWLCLGSAKLDDGERTLMHFPPFAVTWMPQISRWLVPC